MLYDMIMYGVTPFFILTNPIAFLSMFSLKSLLSVSIAASSLILSACGSKDGFAVISNFHFQTPQENTSLSLTFTCNKSTCTVNNEKIDSSSLGLRGFDFSSLRDINAKFQRNGKVNGPYAESMIFNNSFDASSYEYWMGDSYFGVIEGDGYDDSDNHSTMKMAVAAGINTGSRPRKSVIYTGEAIAIYVSDSDGFNTGDVEYGDFYAIYGFGDNTVKINIQFGDWAWSFDSIEVNSDGSFTDNSKITGNFFGNNHTEIAGTSDLPSENVVVSFGGIKD